MCVWPQVIYCDYDSHQQHHVRVARDEKNGRLRVVVEGVVIANLRVSISFWRRDAVAPKVDGNIRFCPGILLVALVRFYPDKHLAVLDRVCLDKHLAVPDILLAVLVHFWNMKGIVDLVVEAVAVSDGNFGSPFGMTEEGAVVFWVGFGTNCRTDYHRPGH